MLPHGLQNPQTASTSSHMPTCQNEAEGGVEEGVRFDTRMHLACMPTEMCTPVPIAAAHITKQRHAQKERNVCHYNPGGAGPVCESTCALCSPLAREMTAKPPAQWSCGSTAATGLCSIYTYVLPGEVVLRLPRLWGCDIWKCTP